MRNQGLMLTRKQLLENVWGWEYAGQSQVLETYVSYLRRKLDPLGPTADPHPARRRLQPAPAVTAAAGGRRSLSLRARLLIGLIALTAVFLVVMGVVSTLVLGTLEQNEFNSELRLAARQSVRPDRQGHPPGSPPPTSR